MSLAEELGAGPASQWPEAHRLPLRLTLLTRIHPRAAQPARLDACLGTLGTPAVTACGRAYQSFCEDSSGPLHARTSR